MAMKPCPECGNAVSREATTCPQCGHPLRSSQQEAEGIVKGVFSIAALGVAGWIGWSIYSMEPAIPEHFQAIDQEATSYLLVAAKDSRYLAGSKYCDSKVIEDRLYILCGQPNEGWGALFHVAPQEGETYSLITMNGPAITMAEKFNLVASRGQFGALPSASEILPQFGTPPERDIATTTAPRPAPRPMN